MGKIKLIPRIYTYKGRWWHGGFCRHGLSEGKSMLPEFWWLVRNGEYYCGWHWPKLVFGIGREWYDGPIYYACLGIWSVNIVCK